MLLVIRFPLVCLVTLFIVSTSFSTSGLSYNKLHRGYISRYKVSMNSWRDNFSTPPDSIIDAVEKTNRLSASDAAVIAGTDITSARKGLMELASLVGGDMDVTQSGDIVYSFPTNLKLRLQQKSIVQRLKPLLPQLYKGIKICFGLTLFASIIIVGTTFIMITSSKDDDKRDSSSSSSSRSSINFNMWSSNPFDTIWYGPRYDYNFDYYQAGSTRASNRPKLGFLEAIYSVVFGDRNPNDGFENEQLRAVAKIIRVKKGVVIAEDLAPFLDPPTPKAIVDTTIVDESWVLPAVVQFQGIPVVTDAGDIVYQFPDLSKSATQYFVEEQSKGGTGAASVTTAASSPSGEIVPLQERLLQFTQADPQQVSTALFLGLINVVGVAWLGGVLTSPFYIARYPFLSLVGRLYPLLVAYAATYFTVPPIRYLQEQVKNADINKRNERRKQWAALLMSTSAIIKAKREAAVQVAAASPELGPRVIGTTDDIVYSTAQNSDNAV